MHSIMVQRVDGMCEGDTSVLAVDIPSSHDAWTIAENIAKSYGEHGIDRTEMVFWFQSPAGLTHIWAEPIGAASSAAPLSERIAALLFDGRHSPCSSRRHRQEALSQAA